MIITSDEAAAIYSSELQFFNSVVGLTPDIARVVGRMSEGDRIHISDTTKHLLDKLGGFRCEYRGVLDLGVSIQKKRNR